VTLDSKSESQRAISVVIPAYRSASILPELVARLDAAIRALAPEYEIILVCDGSPDDSWSVITQMAVQYPHVRGVNLARNYGQHNAILIGIREARYPVIVTMDDDLQHPPEEIHHLVAKLEEGHDVVYGIPQELKHGLFRNLSSVITKYAIQQAMGYKDANKMNAFRAFRTRLRDAFADYGDKFVSIDILLTWGTNKFTHVTVNHAPRSSGVSGYSFRKLLLHAMNIITSYSSLPLQIASLMGFVFMFLGLLIFGYVMISYLQNEGAVPGFTFIASMIAIFSGVQLFSLGIIGEYVARIHFRSMNQPYAIVQERTTSVIV
jgi:glycosyltransferase involved in cell wall biosynthesis